MDGDRDPWTARTAAILDVTRSARSTGPTPVGLPFFGIDHRSPAPLGLVEELATRGIFRKYEHVLDLGGGLGASTRYMAARLGCTATATARTTGEALAARTLTARAGLDWHVFHTVADATRLPYREAAFTHVWVVETLALLGPSAAVLAEAWRVLRPGGHLAIQEFVGRGRDGQRAAEVERAGFVEVVRREVGADRLRETPRSRAAWDQLAGRLGPDDAFVRERDGVATALAAGTLGVVQLTARRP
jgi:SAM-dependent methyltransferase